MITLEKDTAKYVHSLHAMQVHSFSSHLEKYQDETTNPACESLEKTLIRINDPLRGFYKILKDSVLVGGIGVKHISSDTLFIGPVFVDPTFRNQKIAQEALIFLEELFPSIATFQLATIVQELGNIYLYEKLGYVATGEVRNINPIMDIMFSTKMGKFHAL